MMICRIIWVDRVAPKGAEAAMGYEELIIVTMKKIHKKSTNRKQPSESNPINRSHIIKSKMRKQI